MKVDLIARIFGITIVSCPHLTSGWASSMVRIRVVPLPGIPPTKIGDMSLAFDLDCEKKAKYLNRNFLRNQIVNATFKSIYLLLHLAT